MKNKVRNFVPGIIHHIYQRTASREVIFYSISDYLVFFTIICTQARHFGVRILALCPMPDHIHGAYIADSREKLSGFVGGYTSQFTRAHNPVCHCQGSLFENPFGSAVKVGAKKARANLIYIGNNPVERRLCSHAEKYRWNFLAYAVSDHPFSDPLIIRKASWPLVRAVREVHAEANRGRPLNYRQLQRLFAPLDLRERNQLADCIISIYNIIDYEAAGRFFDSYDDMIRAMHSTTGSEYDLNEIFNGRSDACYARMTAFLMRELHLKDIHDVLALPAVVRRDIGDKLSVAAAAPPSQVAAFLRLPH